MVRVREVALKCLSKEVGAVLEPLEQNFTSQFLCEVRIGISPDEWKEILSGRGQGDCEESFFKVKNQEMCLVRVIQDKKV